MLTYEEQLDRDVDWALQEGSMHFDEQNAVHKTLRRIAKRLDELRVDYAIAGGMALFYHGYRRFTEDVDVIVTPKGLDTIHEQLEGHGYLRLFETSKNLRDTTTGVRIDFIVSGQYPGDGKPGPIAFPVPSEVSVEDNGVRILNLVRLIELKLASGSVSHRKRDLADVQDIVQARSLPKDIADELDASVRDVYLALWEDAQRAAADEF